ncbi:hypothetical protein G436_1047 [Leptospira interrogans serovar Hardjo str. Norma]|uniref:Uncharacterized protein n=1 Tax=Leptospira interrogans serovar Hardjo str. Norma TaxID=1279460 RepID=A0A0M3TL02_LEPIR|nr:hypothetical protein G436_1047 [Leptospira interrogans serovar Hardjo str. Norma]
MNLRTNTTIYNHWNIIRSKSPILKPIDNLILPFLNVRELFQSYSF